MAIFKYWLPEFGMDEESAYKVDSECRLAKDIAGDAAKDFHYKRDGLDATWPVRITIEMQNGTQRTFEIDRESRPVFFATEV